MDIVLTGSTGYVGSHVLAALTGAGHTVTAVVRSEEAAAKVKSDKVNAVIGAVTDEPFLVELLRRADGAIHAATTGDQTAAAFDAAVVRAADRAYRDSGKLYVHTAGLWEWGSNPVVVEDDPFDPPALVAWRPAVTEEALAIPGARVSVICSAVVYGDGGGLANLVAGAARDSAGRLTTIGSGRQHWGTIHAADLAALYLRVLETPTAHGRFIAASGASPTVREMSEAAARAAGAPGVITETDDAVRDRLGPYLAEALLLDQQATAAKARTELGWAPSGPGLLEELEYGSYTHHRE
ncbi:NAD-dependent epimerase/dehydratase family protein [Nocardia sp. NPDC051570]|uniref:NAD-dependent epimerase/dehydratase family protein n=1 Tax=Nocardia sp. NPDC051570 TaxID=3364324 RepID=UPI0037B71A7C